MTDSNPQTDRNNAQTRWLNAADLELSQDAQGRLDITIAGQPHHDVRVAKAFALSQPNRYVAFRDHDDNELGILADPAGLSPDCRELLTRRLDQHYFIPVITRVLNIREYFIDQTWTVQTDRGPRQFTLQGRDAIRFLSDGGMLLLDMDDNRYIIQSRMQMDPASRRWIDRFVW